MVDFGIPDDNTQQALYELTGSERLSFNRGGRLRKDYEYYARAVRPAACLTYSMNELLELVSHNESVSETFAVNT